MKSHLELLRNEHLELQKRFTDLQKRYDILEASRVVTGEASSNDQSSAISFAQRLIETVAHLYDRDVYSDITIHVNGHQLRGHRFVLAARTDFWGDLSSVDRIELEGISFSVGTTIMKWIYTNHLELDLGTDYLIEILAAALKYRLQSLNSRCESLLINRLDIDNCVKIYQFAENSNLEKLRDFCSQLVAARWDEFKMEHFLRCEAPLLYKMLKSVFRKATHILNSIIKLQREDVLFLYLVENSANLSSCVNNADENGRIPLDLALETHQLNMAKSLVEHKADVDIVDRDGLTLLWKALERGNVEACEFLVQNGVNVNYVNEQNGETFLHVLARCSSSNEIFIWAKEHISRFNINATDKATKTPLIVAIESDNRQIFDLFVARDETNVNHTTCELKTALELVLFEKNDFDMAGDLAKRKADLNVIDSNGQTLLHKAIITENFPIIQWLISHGADVNIADFENRLPLHIFIEKLPSNNNLSSIQLDTLRVLLKRATTLNVQENNTGLTPAHLIVQKDVEILKHFLTALPTNVSFNVRDKMGRSTFFFTLELPKFDAALLLIEHGANVNEKCVDGIPILIFAMTQKRDDITRFLLDNGADATQKAPNGETCLKLAVDQGLSQTVDYLCKLGANLNAIDPVTGLPPLWTALANEDYATADVLILHGSDTEGWAPNQDGTAEETLLHRAIDMANQKAAVFLIKNGCNVNAIRRYKDQSTDPKHTPLHMAVQWGLTDVSKALISNPNCRVETQDSDGRNACHLAILEQDQSTLELLLSHPDPSFLSLRDRYGLSPLALAMRHKNNRAAEAICKRLPHAAVQVNSVGENLLHSAVKSNDLESVLFLLGLQIDVNIYTQDQAHFTALHLCAKVGSEMILRNLLLAGAEINALSADNLTALHIASYNNHPELVRILLENGADPNCSTDYEGNNALHMAASQGAVEPARVLLMESNINFMAQNRKNQNVLHLSAGCGGAKAVELFQVVMRVYPNYPLEIPDCAGNTVFLLGFMNGNAELCRLALKYGACLAVTNYSGQSIFKFDTPTKQLLFGLLDTLEREPKWADGDVCSECETRFSITMRKHHCRHCGRVSCSRCSERTLPIVKYNLTKNVRVCQLCYDVLSIGAAGFI